VSGNKVDNGSGQPLALRHVGLDRRSRLFANSSKARSSGLVCRPQAVTVRLLGLRTGRHQVLDHLGVTAIGG